VVEDSKWHEAVTIQTKLAKINVGSRMHEITPFENELQLEFRKTDNFYPTRPGTGPRMYEDSLGMIVCVCWGKSMSVCLKFPCLMQSKVFDWCIVTVSRSHSMEFILTSVKSQSEMECLIRTTWDWLYSPNLLHLK